MPSRTELRNITPLQLPSSGHVSAFSSPTAHAMILTAHEALSPQASGSTGARALRRSDRYAGQAWKQAPREKKTAAFVAAFGADGWVPRGPNKSMISAEVQVGGTKKSGTSCL
jgi:hypothetical protein